MVPTEGEAESLVFQTKRSISDNTSKAAHGPQTEDKRCLLAIRMSFPCFKNGTAREPHGIVTV